MMFILKKTFMGCMGIFGIWVCLWRHQLCPSTFWRRPMNMLWPSKCYGQLDITAQTRQRGRQADSHSNPGVCGAHVLLLAQAVGSLPATQSPLQNEQSESRCLWLTPVYAEYPCKERACLSYFKSGVSLAFQPCLHRLNNSLLYLEGFFFFSLFPFLWFNEWGLFLYMGKMP